jgi:hypothetical protein
LSRSQVWVLPAGKHPFVPDVVTRAAVVETTFEKSGAQPPPTGVPGSGRTDPSAPIVSWPRWSGRTDPSPSSSTR